MNRFQALFLKMSYRNLEMQSEPIPSLILEDELSKLRDAKWNDDKAEVNAGLFNITNFI